MLGQPGEVAAQRWPGVPKPGAWRSLEAGTKLGTVAGLFAKIAAEGPDYFYHKEPAEKLVAAVNNAPRNRSKMTMADMAAYQAKERAPICGTYRVYRVCGMGGPSSGGLTVLMV